MEMKLQNGTFYLLDARRRIGARAHQLTEHEIAGIDSLANDVGMPIREATRIANQNA